MRILYVASDQVVPGRTGGSVHVQEVAGGLAARGHEVHAVVHRETGYPDEEERFGARWHRIDWQPPHRLFRFRARHDVAALADRLRPDVVIERYYNFGGEGILTAAERQIPSLLEVNSPAVDHAGSLKAWLDAAMVVRPLRRRRQRLCALASAVVTPLERIVPEFVRDKTETVTWGANVEAFTPARRSAEVRGGLGIGEKEVAVVFSGSFRPWHGVHVLQQAARLLSRRPDIVFVLVGTEGLHPRGYRGIVLGSVPYAGMPEILAAADIGVAPYDPARLGQMRLGFYWSPLKVFEYMASGLPTVTIDRPPLTELVREGEEGLHVPEGDPQALAAAIERLADAPELRASMGEKARTRVVERYSWARHCEQLEAILCRIAS